MVHNSYQSTKDVKDWVLANAIPSSRTRQDYKDHGLDPLRAKAEGFVLFNWLLVVK